jgi:hypothetical protein
LFVGDFNGDGIIDMLAGPNYVSSGKLLIYKGVGTGAFVLESTITVQVAAYNIARPGSVSISDYNSDGKDDFCFGSHRNSLIANQQGQFYCFLGRNIFNTSYSVTEADITLNGQAANDDFGRAAYLYDVTNDGKPDILVGAYQGDSTAGSRHGKFFIYKNTGGAFTGTPWFSEIKTSGNTAFGNSISAADWNRDGWANILITQGGSAVGATGNPVLNMFEISHGTPSATINSVLSITNTPTVTGTASESNTDYNISGVQWSTGNTASGIWNDCVATDGIFDSDSENFSCTISSISDGTGKQIYVRTHDQNELYMPSTLYAVSNVFEYRGHVSSPGNGGNDSYQIPEIGGSNVVSGAFTPYKDSNTGGQQVTTVIEPHTFPFNAFLSSNTTTPSMLASLTSSPGSSANMILTGGSVMGITTPNGGISWQVGNIQEIWYKAYPPRNSDKQPVNILPALQSKPSIISLSYTSKDLIPPGDPTHPFNPKSLKIAYSSDGKVWTIIPSSVVDISNKTVAAIHKLGGYYMIVYQPYSSALTNQKPSVQGVTTEVSSPPEQPIQTPKPTLVIQPSSDPSMQPLNIPVSSLQSRFCILGWCW